MKQIPWFFKPLLATVAAAAVLALIATLTTAPSKSRGLGDGFLWGIASSGFQSEGNPPDSNWTRIANSPLVTDRIGTSVDFRHRYKEDIALAKDLGVKVYRIGIEWSRLEPRPGQSDEAEWAYYDDVVKTIKAAGMRPMLTIDHWVYPGWVADQGGWKVSKTVDDWLANARRVVDRYQADDPLWVTINEPAVYLSMQTVLDGAGADQAASVADRLVRANNEAYDYIHAKSPRSMVTSNLAYMPGIEDQIDTMLTDRMRTDYVGIDYYYGTSAGAPIDIPTALKSDPKKLMEMNLAPWTNPLQPEGIYYVLRRYAKRYPGKPLYIVENGMPTEDGKPRADGVTRAQQIRDTVYWVQRAKDDGIPVIGYNVWSLTDNYEWGSYHPRFGLYTVDVTSDPTLARKPTDGVAAYKRIVAEHGLPDGYRPETAPVSCSQVDPPASCDQPVR
ncbi:family 1 glycosylhydrolase [Segniliparus rugosus]|uniref:Beta-glucosidase n=1 Tax=Segniliparus rugosus (strain ATCC BAA-974 / DSM 45345 / CCUG 50838 / CIP 108380 / JCM 13579 / CDC 945) TaxID=679197 RepID=E5XV07_SEGRC|nr:family 1 glycosylhydrolase [Segniliparus rugosus]EFV11843.1 hypothetical protein HMPREF9336_03329 [Segniliparus rugosus ATCC BAA-974]